MYAIQMVRNVCSRNGIENEQILTNFYFSDVVHVGDRICSGDCSKSWYVFSSKVLEFIGRKRWRFLINLKSTAKYSLFMHMVS